MNSFIYETYNRVIGLRLLYEEIPWLSKGLNLGMTAMGIMAGIPGIGSAIAANEVANHATTSAAGEIGAASQPTNVIHMNNSVATNSMNQFGPAETHSNGALHANTNAIASPNTDRYTTMGYRAGVQGLNNYAQTKDLKGSAMNVAKGQAIGAGIRTAADFIKNTGTA